MQLWSSDGEGNLEIEGVAAELKDAPINARQTGFDLFSAERPLGELPSPV